MNPRAETPTPAAESRTDFWVTFLAALGCFVVFLVVLYVAYVPQLRTAPEVDLTKIPPEEQWKYTPEGRRAHLQELRAREQAALTTYAWIDRGKGIVQLPIDRAEQLTLRELNAERKP
jgi:hypothetical protein